MKIGAMVESFRLDFRAAVEKAASLGIQGLQKYMTKQVPDSEIKEMLDIVKSNGLVFSALCGDLGCGFGNPEKNPSAIETSKRILDMSLKFECGIVTTHIGKITAEETETKEIMRKACRELALYADSVGAVFAVETGPEPAPILCDFLDSLGANGVRVNFDPANLVMCSGDVAAESAKVLGKYIVHTHAKDGYMIGDHEGWKEVPLGEGHVYFDDYIPALASTGFDGFLTIERECGDDPVSDITKAVDFLGEKLDKFNLR
ncbi:MAG: sugar phosphate isomerase/epimerase [Firmicutes bacterium]|nr:sugar phosphate isomerase/epimerase [Bacillota bacterium]